MDAHNEQAIAFQDRVLVLVRLEGDVIAQCAVHVVDIGRDFLVSDRVRAKTRIAVSTAPHETSVAWRERIASVGDGFERGVRRGAVARSVNPIRADVPVYWGVDLKSEENRENQFENEALYFLNLKKRNGSAYRTAVRMKK